MRLTVLSVGYPLAKVSPATAGGAEQVLATLDAGLVREGHRSLVLAPQGSRCDGLLIPAKVPGGILDENAKREARRLFKEELQRALLHYSVDVIHMHGIDFCEYLPVGDLPVVVSLHLPLEWYPRQAICEAGSNITLVSVSDFQARTAPHWCRLDHMISNGVDLDEFRPTHRKSNYVLAMGRFCHEKGLHFAIEAADRAREHLVLAGTVFEYPEHRRYFDSLIAPRLGNRMRFIGPAGGTRKRFLLAGAKCLLIPSQVEETSSLLAMEAMACGTPVIAWRRGALAEIVRHGVTGFVVASLEQMTHAIGRTGEIDRADCRRTAERHFDSREMVSKYLHLYENLTSGAKKQELLAA